MPARTPSRSRPRSRAAAPAPTRRPPLIRRPARAAQRGSPHGPSSSCEHARRRPCRVRRRATTERRHRPACGRPAVPPPRHTSFGRYRLGIAADVAGRLANPVPVLDQRDTHDSPRHILRNPTPGETATLRFLAAGAWRTPANRYWPERAAGVGAQANMVAAAAAAPPSRQSAEARPPARPAARRYSARTSSTQSCGPFSAATLRPPGSA